MMPSLTVISRKKVVKVARDPVGTDFYYADGTGIRVEHRCRNVGHFSHSYADPDRPTGG